MRVVQREWEVVQRKNITLQHLEQFYVKRENKDKLILIYEEETYWCVIDYDILRSVHSQHELQLFLDVDCCHEFLVDEHDAEWANCIFRYTKTKIIPIISENGIEKFMYMGLPMEDHIYRKKLQKLVDYLNKKEISVYCIRMPQLDEMKRNVHEFMYFPGNDLMWRDCNKKLVEESLPFFTEKGYEDAKLAARSSTFLEGRIFGSGQTKIFLVSNGWAGFEGDELAAILNDKLNGEYEIECVLMGPFDTTIQYQILEHDIKKNDIVILMDQTRNWNNSDIDVTTLFNNYEGNKWLYFDLPVHPTRYGNELLAREITEKIIYIHEQGTYDDGNVIVHSGRPQISYHDEELLKKYFNQDDLPNSMLCQCLQKYREYEKNELMGKYKQKILQNMKEFINTHSVIILYGTGKDAQGLLQYLPKKMQEKLQYCDRRANTEEYEFMGVRVMKPNELLGMKNAGILVSSTECKYSIYDTLMKLGIARGQIMFNTLSFGS